MMSLRYHKYFLRLIYHQKETVVSTLNVVDRKHIRYLMNCSDLNVQTLSSDVVQPCVKEGLSTVGKSGICLVIDGRDIDRHNNTYRSQIYKERAYIRISHQGLILTVHI
jgi:hypothetical protein